MLKHLAILERAQLVSAYMMGVKGAPNRKYYRLDKSLYLTIGITGGAFEIDMYDIIEAHFAFKDPGYAKALTRCGEDRVFEQFR